MNKQSNEPESGANTVAGCASVALLVLGCGMAFLTLIAAVNEEFGDAGFCGIASALSFGMLLNALSRR